MMLYVGDKGVGMKRLLVVALVVVTACSNNGSNIEAAELREVVAPSAQVENADLSNAELTTANMKSAVATQVAALTGAEVGCAALAQMVALAQAAVQTGGATHDASWLAGWKPLHNQ